MAGRELNALPGSAYSSLRRLGDLEESAVNGVERAASDTAVAVAPIAVPAIVDAVGRSGARVVTAADADALIWTGVGDPEALRAAVRPQHRWVGLLTAGVDAWHDAGVLDDGRVWTCAHGLYSRAVAEHVMAGVLAWS